MTAQYGLALAIALAAIGFFLLRQAFFPKAVNTALTTKNTILRQMNEPRPLPMGATEFKEWSDRIIAGALVPTENENSLRAALAVMIQSLGPQESHKSDAYFIHSLRKAAANQVSRSIFTDIKNELEAKKAEEIKINPA